MTGISVQRKEIGRSVSTADSELGPVEELVRRLASCAAPENGHGFSSDNQQQEKVVLDVDVDGARYLLIRLPPATRNAIVLSSREQEIVRMVAEGHPNKIIGAILNISSWTVSTHLRRIYAKLGVNSRAAMVAQSLDMRGARELKPRR